MSQNEKCVMVIDEHLPLGIIANTAAVMGITLGKLKPEIVGTTVLDKDFNQHLGVITFPVPILKADASKIQELRELLYQEAYQDVLCVDFTLQAQECKEYEEYIEKMKHVSQKDLVYMGIAICGLKKKVNSLTGSMPLLR
ncbi:DUF2000 domain-containing protein [Amedibacillus sp. YH-ame10]